MFERGVGHAVEGFQSAVERRAVGHQAADGAGEKAGDELVGDGGRGDAIDERRRQAVGVERGRQVGHGGGTIDVVAHVLRARPDRLDRNALEFLGDLHGLSDKADIGAATEAAAEPGGDDFDIVCIDAGRARGDQLRKLRRLRARPHFHARIGHPRGRVDRLHRHMGEEGRGIGGLDVHARRLAHVAARFHHETRLEIRALVERGAIGGEHVPGGEGQGFGIVPDQVQLVFAAKPVHTLPYA